MRSEEFAHSEHIRHGFHIGALHLAVAFGIGYHGIHAPSVVHSPGGIVERAFGETGVGDIYAKRGAWGKL